MTSFATELATPNVTDVGYVRTDTDTLPHLIYKSPVFQQLPEPNRACLVGVYAFLIWNNLCDLVYQTPTESYQSQIPVAFGIPGHVTTKHLPDTPC